MRSTTTELTIFDYLNELDKDDLGELPRILVQNAINDLVIKNSKCLTSKVNNQTPLEYAILNKKPKATEYMIKLLCDFNTVGDAYSIGLESIIRHMIMNNDVKTLQQLLQIPRKLHLSDIYTYAIDFSTDPKILQILLKNAPYKDYSYALQYCIYHKKSKFAEYLIQEYPGVVRSLIDLKLSDNSFLLTLIAKGIIDYAKTPQHFLQAAMELNNLPFLQAMVLADNQEALSTNPALQQTLLRYVVGLPDSPQSNTLFEHLIKEMKTPITLDMYYGTIAKNNMEMFQQLRKADAQFPNHMSRLYAKTQEKQAFAILNYMIDQHPDFPAINQEEINSNPQITPEYKFTETNVKQYLQNQPVIAGEKILPLLIKHNQWNLIASQLIAVADNPWWMSKLLFICIASGKTDFAFFLMKKKPEVLLLKQQNISLLTHIIDHAKHAPLVGNSSDPLLNELQTNYKTTLVKLISELPKNAFVNIAQKNLWHFLLFVLRELQNPAIKPLFTESLVQCLPVVVNANHLLCAEMIVDTLGNKIPQQMLENLQRTTFNHFPAMFLLLRGGLTTKFSSLSQNSGQYFPIQYWVDMQQENWKGMQQASGLQKPELFNKHMEKYLIATFALLQVIAMAPDTSDELKTFIKNLVGNNNDNEYQFIEKIKYPGFPCVPAFNMKMLEPENLDMVLQHPDYLFLNNCKQMLNHIYAMHHWLSTTHKTIKGSNWQVPNRILSGYKPGMPDNMGDIEKVLQNLDKLDHPFRVVGLYFQVKHLFMQIPEKNRHPDTNLFYRSKKSELLQHVFPMKPFSAQELFAKDMAIKSQIDEFEELDDATFLEATIDEFEVMTPSTEPLPDQSVEASQVKKPGFTGKKPGFWEPKNVGPQVDEEKKDNNDKDDPGLGL